MVASLSLVMSQQGYQCFKANLCYVKRILYLIKIYTVIVPPSFDITLYRSNQKVCCDCSTTVALSLNTTCLYQLGINRTKDTYQSACISRALSFQYIILHGLDSFQ